MKTLMLVRARPGVRVPLEGAPHRYIEQDPVPVEQTHYYLRQILDGDLVEVPAAGVPTDKTSPKSGKE